MTGLFFLDINLTIIPVILPISPHPSPDYRLSFLTPTLLVLEEWGN